MTSSDDDLELASGSSRIFSIAGVAFRLRCDLRGPALRLPSSFGPFEIEHPSAPPVLEARVGTIERLEPADGSLLFDSALHWRALVRGDDTVFELFYPPSGERYCRMTVDPSFRRAELLFAETTWLELGARDWLLPHPLDQLWLAPALALRGVCLLHACGAVVDGRAQVFAGHSGEGKTTLARLLASEGVELMSDERVALRREDGGFAAHGTPWPGEGSVVSAASRPLGGLFLLRKAERHSLERESRGSLGPELVARAIIPYYLPRVASRVLTLLSELTARVPLRELGFARAGGLSELLTAHQLDKLSDSSINSMAAKAV